MKNWSLRAKLIVGSSLVLLMILVLNLSFFFSLYKTYQYRELNKKYYDFLLDYNKMLAYQRDFFINYRNDPIFFRTEQSELLRKADLAYTKVKNKVQAFLENPLLNLEELNKFNQIINLLENLNGYFKETTHKLYLRGNAALGSGIIGKIIENYKVAQNNTQDPKLKQDLKNLYIEVLSYLSSLDEKHYEAFLKKYSAINAYIQQQQIAFYQQDTNVTINYTYSDTLNSALQELKNRFRDLVNLDSDLGLLNANSGLLENWKSAINNTNSVTMNLRQSLMEEFNRIFYRNNTLFIIFFVIIMAGSIILFIALQRMIYQRFNTIKAYIEPLKYGQIPEKIEVKLEDEIGQLLHILNRFIEALKRTAEFAVQLGQGNFDMEFQPLSDKDILGNALLRLREDLKRAMEEEEKRKQEERIRQWTNEGISKFAEILRQKTESLQELASNVIKNLVNYLNANQGAFFYLNDDDPKNPYLELLATYAYNKERKKKKTFKLGEGLVGTVAIEKATIYMTDIPEDYISITSGLGGATPRSLLIVPLKAEDEIVGVIEIASFNEMKDYEIKFVEQVAESIGATVSIIKINQRTAKLLEQSQLQAREMAAQEEEMRQNLEELKATQEEAARREAELRSLLNAIETATFVTVLDLNGFIIGANNRLLEALGITHDEYIGHHISEFDLEGKLMDDEFWEQVKSGKTVHYTRHFKIDDKEFWFDEYYAPIIGKKDEVLRYIAISFDISPRIKQQQQLEEQKRELEEKEKQIQQSIKELQVTKERLERQKEEAEKLANKLKANEQILKQALEEAQAKQKQMEELSQKLKAEKAHWTEEYEEYLSMKELVHFYEKQMEKQTEKLQEVQEQYKHDLEEKEKEIQKLKQEIQRLKEEIQNKNKKGNK